MDKIAVIILAAGMGKRMQSDLPKVLAKAGDFSLIQHVLMTVEQLKPEKRIVVIGHKGDLVKENIITGLEQNLYSKDIEFALQKEMLGTGDAVKSTLPLLENFIGTVLILCGDTPLIRADSLKNLLATHNNSQATITMLSVEVLEENSYGRVIRNEDGFVAKIVEFKDCSDSEKLITETNSGIYAVDSAFLKPALDRLTNNNAQGEYYLTDIIEQAVKEGQNVAISKNTDLREFQGVNTQQDLALVTEELNRRNNN